MKEKGLVSKYTCKKHCINTEKSNESTASNQLNRQFKVGQQRKVIVTDLTYMSVKQHWHYLCVIVDVSNRESVRPSTGKHKNAQLIMDVISHIPINLKSVKLFHSNRAKAFDNHLLDECLKELGIQRSLSHKGRSYDNAIAEAAFKTVKTELVSNTIFDSLKQIRLTFYHYMD